MTTTNQRERHGSLIPAILGWLLFFLIAGPSIVGLTRALTSCQVWKTPQGSEAGVPDEALREATKDIPDYARPESNTYLSLPEWDIIYSTDQYAAFIANNPPSQFPYFKAVGQFWESYADACGAVKGRFPSNGRYHFKLAVMGISFTADNMIKGAYEMTIGRFAELTTSGEATEEEIYARNVAKEYADSLHHAPWYLFPFREKLQGLWSETGTSGPNLIRKWERKLQLTFEYGGKMLYGGLISYGANALYGGPDTPRIYAVATGIASDMAGNDLEIVKDIDGQRQLIRISRFDTFTGIIPGLTERGLGFVEIAGNDEILFTVIGPKDADYNFQSGKYLFSLPIIAQPELVRAAIQVHVADMPLLLIELKTRTDLKLEHIYDY